LKVLILGMGNPILSDDGIGLLIAEEIGKRVKGAEVVTTALVGVHLLDLIAGYDKVFLIDALTTVGGIKGEVVKLKDGGATSHLFSSHGVNFFELLRLGGELGYKMPELGRVYGIEIGDEIAFGEELSPELKERLPCIIEKIADDVRSHLNPPCV